MSRSKEEGFRKGHQGSVAEQAAKRKVEWDVTAAGPPRVRTAGQGNDGTPNAGASTDKGECTRWEPQWDPQGE